MKNKDIKNLETRAYALKRISLDAKEKTEIKNNLSVFISSGVRNETFERLITPKSRLLNIINFRYMPIALAITLFLGGGVTYAAEGSLPGDILYPIKTGINENVRVVLSFSEEAKARAEAELAVRRLEEAEALAVSGRLDAEAQAQVGERFEKHSKRAESRIDRMKNRNNLVAAAEVSSDLESSIRAHGLVLKSLLSTDNLVKAESSADSTMALRVNDGSKDSSGDDGLAVKIMGNADIMFITRNGIDAKISTDSNANIKVAVQKRLSSIKDRIADLNNYVEERKDKITTEVYAEAKARIELANKLVVEAEAKIESGADYTYIFDLIAKIHSIIVETRVFVNINSSLDIGFKFNGYHGEPSQYRNQDNRDGGASSDFEAEVRINSNEGGGSMVGSGGIRVNIPSAETIKKAIDNERVRIEVPRIDVEIEPIKIEADSTIDLKTEPLKLDSRSRLRSEIDSGVRTESLIDTRLRLGR